jgi:Flp pilus assembly protein CpaB
MTYRTRNILLAAGLAVLAAIFMLFYVSNSRDSNDVGNGLVRVLVASSDINEGTPGSSLTAGSFVEKRIPLKAEVPGAIRSEAEVRGLVATQQTLSGEQVTTRRFGPLAATGVRAKISRRLRTVQLAGDPNQVLDGTVKAGDRVDVMATWSVPHDCDTCKIVRTLVRGALVLATSSDLPSIANAGSTGSKPVQIRVTDREAERVFWMEKNGEWWLALRPVVKPRSAPQDLQNAESIARATRR